ncbi:ABC transporter, putative [Bodo saltans]|uniref:ABC transporter, putative n=1 Tax=Bodo saltans TaxID=75058 RepID=A0A0S4JPA7_BODSA|nr:ABC transporter, putative [Bodo saltans]|eukprot:CUG92291.1 ABC transporter, putative [Bodo saltans]
MTDFSVALFKGVNDQNNNEYAAPADDICLNRWSAHDRDASCKQFVVFCCCELSMFLSLFCLPFLIFLIYFYEQTNDPSTTRGSTNRPLFPRNNTMTTISANNSREEAELPTSPTAPPTMQAYQKSSLTSMSIDTTVDFSWENFKYDVEVVGNDGAPTMKTLLHKMSGTARGGRVLAVMGPSGAGKTTLMSGIIGRLQTDAKHQLGGCVFLYHTVFTERYKKLVSFVAQDDLVLGRETPAEAFYFSSRVRLGLTHEEATERTEDTLSRLHLQKCRDTYLGIPGLEKGVSGGEKKRTNIGTELITNPYVMLLDEPTTGLDSVNALRVGRLLQDLAHDDKRTVLCTIHSPSSELFAVFDDLLLLAKGHVIYHGPMSGAAEYFASIGYPVPPRTNPAEYYMNLLQLPLSGLEALWESWEQHLLSAAADKNMSVAPVVATVSTHNADLDRRVGEKGSSFMLQFTQLTVRAWRQFLRDPGATFNRAARTIFFAVLIGLFFFSVDNTAQGVQDRAGGLYLIMLNTFMTAATTGVAVFPPERAVFLMEQSSESYNAFAYALAKTVAELPFQIGFPVVFTGTFYFMVGFVATAEAFFKMLLVIILAGNLGYSFGLMAASVLPTAEAAITLVPMVIMPMGLVGGLFANSDRLEPAWEWLEYISLPLHDATCSYKTGQDVINYYGFTKHSWGTYVYAQILYLIGIKLISAVALWHHGKKKRGNLTFHHGIESREMTPRAVSWSSRNVSPANDDAREPMPR